MLELNDQPEQTIEDFLRTCCVAEASALEQELGTVYRITKKICGVSGRKGTDLQQARCVIDN